MKSRYIEKMLVCALSIAIVCANIGTGVPYVYADTEESVTPSVDQIIEEQPVEEPEEKSVPEISEKDKKAEEKAKKKKATLKNQQKIVKFAKKQIGKRYRHGGFGPNSFDCIGLVYYVFKNAGAKLKSSMTYDKACHMKTRYNKYIVSHSIKKAKAGDIIIYYSGNHVKHACIAIGNGKCVNASKSGVKIKKIPTYSGCKVGVIRLVK